MPRAELGAFGLNVLDVQEAYDDMLAFNDILRAGKVLNLSPDGFPVGRGSCINTTHIK